MKSVVFVAPMFRANTNRYVRALAALPETRVGVISQEPAEAIEPDVRGRIAAHFQVRSSSDSDELARACRGLATTLGPIDRLLGMLEELQIPLAEARDACGIPGMTPLVARNFRDKAQMKDALRRAGVPVARHRLLRSERDLWGFVQEVGFPVVLKPPAGLGAKGTFRVRNPEELTAALQHFSPTPLDPVQAEEFVTGQENTCETVTIDGKPVWHSGTRYLPGPLEVIENPWMQYCVLLPRETDERDFTSFHPINTAALRALGMGTGITHMEWFRRKDGGAVVGEVGARPPGAQIMPLMSHAHDADMVSKWCELMVHDRFDAPTRKFAAGCAFFRGQGTGRVKAITGLDAAQEEVGALVVDRRIPVVGQFKADSYEGEGYAVVKHPDTKVVLHALKRLVSLVRIALG